MTVVRLQNGDVWLHSPIKATPALIAEIRALGPVTHLIAPNWIHYAFVADWQAHFTQALCWAAPGVAKRAASRGTALRIDHDLGDSAETPWSGQIEQRTAVLFEVGSPCRFQTCRLRHRLDRLS